MISEAYRAQVDLLLQVLPHTTKEESFALKGGASRRGGKQHPPALRWIAPSFVLRIERK